MLIVLLSLRQTFIRDPSIEEWDVFLKKASHVRIFRDPTFGGGPSRLSDSAIAAIARSRPSTAGTIFPRLQTFYMTSLGTRRLFMSESVKHFVWRIEAAVVGGEMQRVCEEIVYAMPHIELLRIQVASVDLVQDSLAWMCRRLSSLHRIILPPYGLTSSLFEALSSLPSLVDIDFERFLQEQPVPFQQPSMAGVRPFSLGGVIFPQSSFSSLIRLSIGLDSFIPLWEVLGLSVIKIFALQRLTVRIPFRGDNVGAEVKRLLQLFGGGRSRLQALALHLAPRDVDDLPQAATSRAITLSDIEPLKNLPMLQYFSLHAAKPLNMDDADMRSLAMMIPAIKVLRLNHHPSLSLAPHCTFSAISSFAQYCADLRDLAVYVNGEVDLRWRSRPAFGPKLHTLQLGRSWLPGSDDLCHRRQVASCIGDLIPTSVNVICLRVEDVLDSGDLGPVLREMPSTTNPVWRSWMLEFRSNWDDIWVLARTVACERAMLGGGVVSEEEMSLSMEDVNR